MKRYITYILATLSLVYIASCTQSDEIANPNDSGHMVLLFQSSTMTRSADDTADLNEDLITSIDCYFYPNGGENSNAVWHYSEDNLTVNGSHTISNTLMPAGDMAKVFPSGATQGTMYVIANYTGDDLPSGENLAGSSIAALKQKVVTTIWPQGGSWQAQDSFVMDGQSTISKGEGNAISGTVNLTRAAAKIELTITSIDAEVKGTDGCTYVPALSGGAEFGLTMHNAATKSYIDNAWDGSKLAYNADATSGHNSLAGYTFTADGSQFKQTNPLYSYPTHWGAGPSGEAYLLLVVPWQKTKDADGNDVTNETPKPYYYEIPIGKLENNVISEHIARNHHYQISIHVGTLGSFVQEEPVTLTPSYMVVDWTSGKIEAEIKDQRYLVVDQKNIEVSNKDVCSVIYATSHDVAAEIESIVFYDLTGNTAEEQTITSFTTSTSGDETTYRFTYKGRTYTFILKAVNGELSVTHVLQNNKDLDDFDYVPYTINVNIHHSEEQYADDFSENVSFKQYPAMYITAYQNPDYDNGTSVNENNGYMFVNGYTGSYTTINNYRGGYTYPTTYKRFGSNNNYIYVQFLGSANGMSDSATNKNPNSYLLTLSSFSDNTYVIGDPRTQEVDNTLVDATFTPINQSGARTIWRSAPALDGTTRTLTYPYPTRATEDTKNMIAPQIRVASSYSVLSSSFVTQKEIARRRCASYQEAGYPAGRWRLPTKAEAEYMVKLSAEGLIPALFTSGSQYWCAHGYFTPYNTASGNHAAGDVVYVESDTNDGASVRCVYDVWYWGDERISDISTFTWGDMPR